MWILSHQQRLTVNICNYTCDIYTFLCPDNESSNTDFVAKQSQNLNMLTYCNVDKNCVLSKPGVFLVTFYSKYEFSLVNSR